MANNRFNSILDLKEEELKKMARDGFVVEYIPGEGFIFDNIEHVNSITEDMFSHVPVIPLTNLF